MTSLEFRDRLARRTRRAKAPISLAMLDPLEAYFRLLTQWNAKINLTSLPLAPPSDEAFDRLLVEALAASRQITTDASLVWVDLGAGGGSPAIPLKIARPALNLTMVESKERKGAFLREAARSLGMTGALVEIQRFEELAETPRYSGAVDLITVRAVRADTDLFDAAGRLLKRDGRLFLFRPAHSAGPDPAGFVQVQTVPLTDSPPSFLTILRRVFHVEHSKQSE